MYRQKMKSYGVLFSQGLSMSSISNLRFGGILCDVR